MKERKFHKCNFCQATPSPRFSNDSSRYFKICLPRDAVDHIEFTEYEFICENNHEQFRLDGDKVVETAKELGISVRDVLDLIDAASK